MRARKRTEEIHPDILQEAVNVAAVVLENEGILEAATPLGNTVGKVMLVDPEIHLEREAPVFKPVWLGSVIFVLVWN